MVWSSGCSSTLQTKLCTVCLTVCFSPITHSSLTVKHLSYIGLITASCLALAQESEPSGKQKRGVWGRDWTDRTAGKKNKPRESSGCGRRGRHPAVSKAGTHLWVQWPLPSPITPTPTPWDIWESVSITNQRETRKNLPLTTLRSSNVYDPIPSLSVFFI